LSSERTYYYAANVIDEDEEEEEKERKKKNPSFVYDEIPALLLIDGYGMYDLDVIYTNNDLLYVNIENLFHILMIPCVVYQRGDSLAGFIENEDNTYFIDYSNKQIKVGEKTFSCKNEMVKEMGMVYLESSLLAKAFGISLTFNYRSLLVVLKSDFELPLFKQQRLEKMRDNLSKIHGEIVTDTILNRNYNLFKFGMLDWSMSSTQSSNDLTRSKFGIGFGAELLYGEANVSVIYDNKYGFEDDDLHYRWRWVDNDKKIIKQAQIGKISNQSIAFYNSPLVGAVIRNAPTTVRKATGYYTISDYTEPNWTVELFINDVMVDYTKADASGMYFFEVPNIYGFTTIKLKFYGPMGEERMEERTTNIPYTFMPEKEFEYGITSGIIQDSSLSRYGKVEANYGLTRKITIGAGLEYLSSIQNRPYIPYVKTSIQPFSKLTFIGEYAHGVRAKGLMNYYFFKNASIIVDYAKYVKDQQATQFKYLEERKILLSIPFRYRNVSGFSKIDFSQYVYKTFTYNQTNIILSVYYKQFSINSTTQLNWTNEHSSYILTTNSLSWRLKRGFVFRPSTRYDHVQNTLDFYKIELEKKSRRSNFTISYERNISLNDHVFSIGFRYNLSFARANVTAMHSKNMYSISENAQGSIMFGSGNRRVLTSENSSVGKGGISIYPFLDLNNNGIFDQGEKMVKISSVKAYGAQVIYSKKDSIIRMQNLNPFISYVIEFNNNDLDNIAWRFKNKIYSIFVDPNQYRRVDVPIVCVGEAIGMVYKNNNNLLKGIGRITVEFYKKDSDELIVKTLSESDGYINYLGFAPGEYVARIDSLQLNKLDFVSEPSQINFTIKALEEGDIVDGLEFVLKSKEKRSEDSSVYENNINGSKKEEVFEKIEIINDTALNLPPAKDSIEATTLPEKKNVRDSVSKNNSANKTKTNSNINTSFGKISDINGLFYSVQIGVYKNYVTAKQLTNLTPIFYETLPNGNNRYFSGKYNSEEEAEKAKNVIIAKGVKDAFVVTISKGVRLAATTSQPDKTEFSKIVNKPVFNLQPTKDSLEVNDSIIENNSANKTKTNSNINTSFGKISDINGLFYSVQIGVYKKYVTAKQLKNLSPIFYETLSNGNNRYFSGKYNSAAEAEKAKKGIIAKGIKDAFVVTISKGVKLAATTLQPDKSVINVLFEENVADCIDFTVTNLNNYKR